MYISYGEMTIFAKQHMLSKLSSLTRLEWSFAYHPCFLRESPSFDIRLFPRDVHK